MSWYFSKSLFFKLFTTILWQSFLFKNRSKCRKSLVFTYEPPKAVWVLVFDVLVFYWFGQGQNRSTHNEAQKTLAVDSHLDGHFFLQRTFFWLLMVFSGLDLFDTKPLWTDIQNYTGVDWFFRLTNPDMGSVPQCYHFRFFPSIAKLLGSILELEIDLVDIGIVRGIDKGSKLRPY